MIEDSLIPIQQDQLVRSALRFANKIDKDCIAVIQAGSGSSVTASGKSLAFDGTEFVISGSGGPGIGTYIFQEKKLIKNLLENSKNDIINAKAQVEQYNYMPDTMLCHPLAKSHIEKLPHFTSLMHYGEPILQEGLMQTPGKFGDILGLDAFSSTNCPTGSVFVLSRGRTSNILGQYKGLEDWNLKIDNRYIAGFFDGEGSVSINIWKSKENKFGYILTPSVSMCQKQIKVLEIIQEKLKFGKIEKIFEKKEISSKGNAYVLRIERKDMKKFIKDIKPFSIVKRQQLELMEEALEIWNKKYPQQFGQPKEDFLNLLSLTIEIRSLNTKHSLPKYDLINLKEQIEKFDELSHYQKIKNIHSNLGSINNFNNLKSESLTLL